MSKFRWEFIRRNKSYIEDCEEWSGRKRHGWKPDEIILNYPLGHEPLPIEKPLDLRYLKYHDTNVSVWNGLTIKGAWREHWKKWQVFWPLNPLIDFADRLPFFMEVVPCHIVHEPDLILQQRNDRDLDHTTVSTLDINWAAPKTILTKEFERILNEKKRLVEKKWEIQPGTRRSYEVYPQFLKVWDMKEAHPDWTWEAIARRLYPKKIQHRGVKGRESAHAATGLVKEYYKACKKLIGGDWAKI